MKYIRKLHMPYGFYVIIKIVLKNLEIEKKEPQRTYLSVWTILAEDWLFLDIIFSLFQNKKMQWGNIFCMKSVLLVIC